MRRALNGCILSMLVCILFFALTVNATVTGKVSDTSGNPVMGAALTFTDESNPESTISGVTGSDGSYSIDLPLGVQEDASNMPQAFSLGQNYPNPFNPSTIIPFSLDESGNARLDIYNIMGQHLRTVIDGYYNAGSHTIIWDACDNYGNHLSAGIYLYRLSVAGTAISKKMLLLDGGIGSGVGASYVAESVYNSGIKNAAKIAEGTTYTVTIIHDSIIPYEETGVSVAEGQTLDFVVSLIGGPIVINGITFVTIPGGSFHMGDIQGGGYSIERPVHDVTLSAFEMSIYEITQEQYSSIIGTNPSSFSGTNLPVERVTWYDAVKFCNALSEAAGLDRCYDESTWECDFSKNGYRLPTEAEWEYACRAGTETKFYTGNNLSSDDRTSTDLDTAGWYLNNWGDENNKTHTVGAKVPNAFLLYDMHGNVGEWCNDWFGSTYYSNSPSTDPTGPSNGSVRVVRNSGWRSFAAGCRSATRGGAVQSYSDDFVGFRVVRRTTDDGTGDTAEWQTVFFDDFNRSDGDLGNDLSVDIYPAGTVEIESNKLKITAAEKTMYAINYSEVNANSIRASVICSTTTVNTSQEVYGIAVSARGKLIDIVDNIPRQQYYSAGFGTINGDGSVTAPSISISKTTIDGFSTLASKEYEIAENRSYKIVLTVNNNNLTMVVTDMVTAEVATITATDQNPLTEGIVSLNGYQSNNLVLFIDDFKIEKYE
ncbi:SUMF1/EgtB/PvdO family nonheme iron enzyme [Candidatus Latescibacterota bacterium]